MNKKLSLDDFDVSDIKELQRMEEYTRIFIEKELSKTLEKDIPDLQE